MYVLYVPTPPVRVASLLKTNQGTCVCNAHCLNSSSWMPKIVRSATKSIRLEGLVDRPVASLAFATHLAFSKSIGENCHLANGYCLCLDIQVGNHVSSLSVLQPRFTPPLQATELHVLKLTLSADFPKTYVRGNRPDNWLTVCIYLRPRAGPCKYYNNGACIYQRGEEMESEVDNKYPS